MGIFIRRGERDACVEEALIVIGYLPMHPRRASANPTIIRSAGTRVLRPTRLQTGPVCGVDSARLRVEGNTLLDQASSEHRRGKEWWIHDEERGGEGALVAGRLRDHPGHLSRRASRFKLQLSYCGVAKKLGG